AEAARGHARAHPGPLGADDLPWAVVRAWDADVRGHVERDPRLEDGRDRVLIAAVNFAEAALHDGPDRAEPARERLLAAIDDLERLTLRFGRANHRAAQAGYGEAGQPIA
ncbi:hypothetical protein, partial [Methylobacterium oryzisoli]